VTGIALDTMERAWAIDEKGNVCRLDASPAIEYQLGANKMDGQNRADLQLFFDRNGHPWVYATSLSMGVYWWPAQDAEPVHLTTASNRMPLNNTIIFGMAEDPEGNLWIATDHGGVNLI